MLFHENLLFVWRNNNLRQDCLNAFVMGSGLSLVAKKPDSGAHMKK